MVTPVDTAEKIKKARAFLGKTREAFGQLCGVSARTVHYWETGRRHPHKAVLKLLDPILWEAILGERR